MTQDHKILLDTVIAYLKEPSSDGTYKRLAQRNTLSALATNQLMAGTQYPRQLTEDELNNHVEIIYSIDNKVMQEHFENSTKAQEWLENNQDITIEEIL